MMKNRILLRWIAVISLTLMLPSLGFAVSAPVSSVPFTTALAEAQAIVSQQSSWMLYRTEGDSMNPYFGAAALLLVQKASVESLRPGMIAVYEDAEGDLVAHRVERITAEGVIAKGVNNLSEDPLPIRSEALRGVVFGTLHTRGDAPNNIDVPVAYGKRF